MATTAWMTSAQLIDAIKRKISFPLAQQTFSEEDLLAFANEEMMIAQVPSILEHHEEYFVAYQVVPLVAGQIRYSLPKRAIGDKLRDIFYSDNQTIAGQEYGNLYEVTRINPSQKAFFQQNSLVPDVIQGFYMEGSYVVLTQTVSSSPTGKLVMFYFLRPNQLVLNNRAAICAGFTKTTVIDNTAISVGDTFVIGSQTFTAISGSPLANEFLIGANSVATAGNLAAAINTNGTYTATNSNSATLTVSYEDRQVAFSTSNTLGFAIQATQTIVFDNIPANIASNTKVDFLQTPGAHKTYKMDIKLSSSAVSGMSITFNDSDVPTYFEVGDYICTAGECIVPQIPSDLHNGLAERTCARILSALGDAAGLQMTNAKIQDIVSAENKMVSNRVEGAPIKVNNIHSALRYGKWTGWRRI